MSRIRSLVLCGLAFVAVAFCFVMPAAAVQLGDDVVFVIADTNRDPMPMVIVISEKALLPDVVALGHDGGYEPFAGFHGRAPYGLKPAYQASMITDGHSLYGMRWRC